MSSKETPLVASINTHCHTMAARGIDCTLICVGRQHVDMLMNEYFPHGVPPSYAGVPNGWIIGDLINPATNSIMRIKIDSTPTDELFHLASIIMGETIYLDLLLMEHEYATASA